MSHAQKIDIMFDDLSRRGIGRWSFALPLYRALWKLGVEIPPPHFSTFSFLFGFQGGFFTVWCVLLISLVPYLLPLDRLSFLAVLLASIAAGFFFGFCMARYYTAQAKRHGLPLWRDYQNA